MAIRTLSDVHHKQEKSKSIPLKTQIHPPIDNRFLSWYEGKLQPWLLPGLFYNSNQIKAGSGNYPRDHMRKLLLVSNEIILPYKINRCSDL